LQGGDERGVIIDAEDGMRTAELGSEFSIFSRDRPARMGRIPRATASRAINSPV